MTRRHTASALGLPGQTTPRSHIDLDYTLSRVCAPTSSTRFQRTFFLFSFFNAPFALLSALNDEQFTAAKTLQFSASISLPNEHSALFCTKTSARASGMNLSAPLANAPLQRRAWHRSAAPQAVSSRPQLAPRPAACRQWQTPLAPQAQGCPHGLRSLAFPGVSRRAPVCHGALALGATEEREDDPAAYDNEIWGVALPALAGMLLEPIIGVINTGESIVAAVTSAPRHAASLASALRASGLCATLRQ